MANRFLSNIRINDAYTFPASDGSAGQAIITDGAGNLSFGTVSGGGGASASVVYRENFTGDGTTTDFTLTRTITDENITQVYIDGVYQEKDAYSIVSLNTISFTAAPPSGDSIEVMYFYAIDAIPQPSTSVIYRDNFTGDGTTTAFTLANSIEAEDHTQVYIDGAYQEKGTYTAVGTSLTFATAPASGHSVEVISIAALTRDYSPTTIYQDNFTGDGTTVAFTMQNAVDDEVKTMVYFDGVYQFKGTYTVDGVTITFDAAPASGVNVEVITIASARGFEYNSQTLYFYGKANEAISKGDAIMFAGQQGDHFLFAKATQAAIAANHEYFLGLATQDLLIGEFGYVTEFGNVTGLDTTTYTAGDILWFDAGGTTAGALTNVEPAPPLVKIQVAAVIREHAEEGILFVRPTWYHELNELHDVNITSVADKDMLVWDNANGYWENSKTLGDITVGTLTATSVGGTLSTAAQPNITSVGTLTGLTVSSDATINSLTVGRGSGNASSNTAVGIGALDANTSGAGNVAIGTGALEDNTTANSNVAIGVNSLRFNTTASYNTAVGHSTLFSNTSGASNVAFGYATMYNNTTGSANSAFGEGALKANTTGSTNSALGTESLFSNTTGIDNTGIGYTALRNNISSNYNTALGARSLQSNTTGSFNTALGRATLNLNTTGEHNVAIGMNSMLYNTAGSNNTAVGSNALRDNSGSSNTAIGKDALISNTSGNSNTAVGINSLKTVNTGIQNTAVGAGSLEFNTGSYNTAIGRTALYANTSASYNTAIGKGALESNTTGASNTSVGFHSLLANTTGANNTALGTNALISNTTGPYNVAVGRDTLTNNTTQAYNVAIGYTALQNSTANYNTAIGGQSMRDNTTGSDNVAVGLNSLLSNTTAYQNTAVGRDAMYNNTTGFENTAIGRNALYSNTTANYNTAVGRAALNANTTGGDNTSIGRNSMVANVSGGSNVAIGNNALGSNTTGNQSTAIGTNALLSNNATQNTAVGSEALKAVTTGGNNVAVGHAALLSQTTAYSNTGLGYAAGLSITTGQNNLLLGTNAGRSTSPSGNITTASNIVVLGDNSITNLYCADTTISSSDARDKTDVEDFTHGLDWITQLRPVTYRWDKRAWYVDDESTTEDLLNAQPDGSRKRSKLHIGFLAQEELEVEKQFGFGETKDDMLIANLNEDESAYGIKYERLVPVLVNAIKEQQNIINDLKARIETLESK